MANVFLAWQNRIDSATLSGGSWNASLPLANIQNPVIQRVSRTSNATADASQFSIDLGTARPIGVVSLIAHTISQDGHVRVTGADNSAALTNLLTFGSDLRNTAEAGASRPWTQNDDAGDGVLVTLVANGPDGGSASKLQAGNTGAQTRIVSQSFSAANGTTVTAQVIAKAGECSNLNVRIGTRDGAFPSATFDLSAGAVAATYSDAGRSLTSATITQNGEWWRCTVVCNVQTGGTTPSIGLGLRSQLDSLSELTSGASLDLSFTGGVFQQFDPDFNSTAPGQGLFLSGASVVDGAGYIYDSGWLPVWPSDTLAMGQRNWEDDNFWTGQLTDDYLVGLQSPFVHTFDEQYLRYWKVEISDTTNPDGYIDVGRCMMARGWRPGVNYTYGAEISYFDQSPSVTTLSGTMYFDQRPRGRLFRFSLDAMSSTEAYNYALEMQRLAGVTSEVLLVPDSDDVGNIPLRSFAGRLTALNGIGVPDPSRFTGTFELKEII